MYVYFTLPDIVNNMETHSGITMLDNISIEPCVDFDIDTLCTDPISYLLTPIDLSPDLLIDYTVLSNNITNFVQSGDSCTFELTGYTAGVASQIEIEYVVTDTACNGNVCDYSDTLIVSIYPYIPMETNTWQIQEVSCVPICDGIVTTAPTYGASPYTFLWNNMVTTATNSSACAGMNYVTITDSNGCTLEDSVMVTDTVNIEILNVIIQKCPCVGSNSVVTLPNDSIINGTAPYSYIWSVSGQTTNSITNVGPGIHTVTVIDANGCVDSLEFNVSCIELQYRDYYDASCPDKCDGWIQSVTAGPMCPGVWPVSPVTFQWSNGVTMTGGDLTGLCPGEYWVTITDASGMIGYDTITIGYNYDPVLSTSINNVSCLGACDGALEATFNSPAFPFITFDLYTTPLQTVVSPNPVGDFYSLCDGSYLLVATDANGCVDSTQVLIETEDFYNVDTLVSVNCGQNDTVCIDLTTIGVYQPFSYAWSNGATTQDVCVTAPGTYYVTTTNSNSCSIVNTFVLASNPLQANVLPSPPTCETITNGVIDLNITGGMPPYYFAWSTGESTQMISGLGVGTFEVTVSDSYGCTVSEAITFTDYLYLISSLAVTPPTCVDANGNSTLGSIDLTPDDGVPPYSYNWSTTAQTEDISGLNAGTYIVTITDSEGCIITDTAYVSTPTLVIDLHDIGQGCDGDSLDPNLDINGTLDATITGGTPPYTYSWNVPGSTANLTGLTDYNTYIVTVTDANNCIGVDSVKLLSEQTIYLDNGWSFFSTYIDLGGTQVVDFFNENGLSSEIIKMQYSNGWIYEPAIGTNTIGTFTNGHGYQVKMTPTTPSFTTRGSLICPEDYPIEIIYDTTVASYFFAYLRKTPSPIADELSSIASSIQIVKNGAGAIFWPQFINTIGDMIPGEGYDMITQNSVSWYYSDNNDNVGTKSAGNVTPMPENSDIITDQSMVIGIPNNTWTVQPNIGDVIQAVGENGQVVGRAYYTGDFAAMCLFGDDSTTPEIHEGLSEGEPFTLEIISLANKSVSNAQVDLKNWVYGDGNYTKDKVSLLGENDVINPNEKLSKKSLTIYPNPNRGQFAVELESMNEESVYLCIRNMAGQVLYAENKVELQKGNNKIVLNIPNLAEGTYVVNVRSNTEATTGLLIIAK